MNDLDLSSLQNKRPHPDPPDLSEGPSPSKEGRLDYSKSSTSTKNRRVNEILNKFHPDVIVKAAIRALKEQGHVNASKALEHIKNDPEQLDDVHNFIKTVKKEKVPSVITPCRALQHKLELGLSVRQYEKTAAVGNPNSIDKRIWPPIHQLNKEQENLRPEVTNIYIEMQILDFFVSF